MLVEMWKMFILCRMETTPQNLTNEALPGVTTSAVHPLAEGLDSPRLPLVIDDSLGIVITAVAGIILLMKRILKVIL